MKAKYSILLLWMTKLVASAIVHQSVLDLGLSWQAGGRVTAAWRAYNFKFRG
jgi:hypothetical protein